MLNKCFKSMFCTLVCFSSIAAQSQMVWAQETIAGKTILSGDWQGRHIEYVDGEISLFLEVNEMNSTIQTIKQSFNANIKTRFDERGWGVIELPQGASTHNVAHQLMELSGVRVAEPVMIHRILGDFDEVNDQLYRDGYQWSLKNIGQTPAEGMVDADIDISEAWGITMGGTTDTIAVLDSGISLNSSGSVLLTGDLNSGRFILGEDFIDDPPDGVRDMRGHGTHVTGILSAQTNNESGIAGVAGNCKILVIQVFSSTGIGTDPAFKLGVEYAVEHGAKVINYSGQGDSSATLESAVAYAYEHGVILVAAAGNNYGGTVRFPAAYSTDYDNVIAVGATDHNDVIAGYSNVGRQVNVVAPGGQGHPLDEDDILSTMPPYNVYYNNYPYYVSMYFGYMAGTSMAAPHVTGIAALVLDRFPNKTPGQVRTIIEKSAEDLGAVGFDTTYGHGRVNAYYAVAPPDPPTSLSISGGQDDHPQLHWTHPEAPDVRYIHIKRTIDGSNTYFMVAGTATSWTDNQIYIDTDPRSELVTYQVRARDYTDQYSPYSNSASTRTSAIPMSGGSGQEIALFNDELPDAFTLESPSPNPFNASTTVRFGLPVAGQVRLDIFDINGRLVTPLLNGERPAGWSTITWDASSVASGTYFLLAKIGGEVHNRKLVVIK